MAIWTETYPIEYHRCVRPSERWHLGRRWVRPENQQRRDG